MDVNNFLSTLKNGQNGMDNNVIELEKTYTQYKNICKSLSSKDKLPFSLNVLCTLCRNIEKSPSWSSVINDKYLLILCIECARETRTHEADKTLGCLYHMHRHVIRKNTTIPPEFVLKLSYMPFESKNLLKEYYKTYWSILADRITYIEKLKAKVQVNKLLTSLSQDLLKTTNIFDTKDFCTTILLYVIKKLYIIFPDSSKELNVVYRDIFHAIFEADISSFKTLSDKDALDLYVKFNDCLSVLIENSSKINFKDSHIANAVETCMKLLITKKDIIYCFQTLYINSICHIVTEHSNIETVFNSLTAVCKSNEEIGYTKIMTMTYPYISHIMKSYIESEKFKENITTANSTLEFIIFLIDKLKFTSQLLKCDGCNIKTGQHDAIRLTFLTKSVVTMTSDTDILNLLLPTFYTIVQKQYNILFDLKKQGCPNYDKYFKKLQATIHNTAICLHSLGQSRFSVNFFNIYIEYELRESNTNFDKRCISRALYNKGISELELQLLEEAIKSAYLSMIFALPESLNTVKYMDLVNNIKSKSKDGDDSSDQLRYRSCLDVCLMSLTDYQYKELAKFIKKVKFSELLYHEHKMYMQHWPSVKPIAGVCNALYSLLYNSEHPSDDIQMKRESRELILETIYKVILDVTKIRNINLDVFKKVTAGLLERFEEKPPITLNHELVFVVLMMMKSEHDVSAAAEKHKWNDPELMVVDPDTDDTHRSIHLEHEALQYALRAVDHMTALLPQLQTCGSTLPWAFETALHVSQALVQGLLYMNRTVYGLQLALICCNMASIMNDSTAYIRNAGAIVYHAHKRSQFVDELIRDGNKLLKPLMADVKTLGVALGYVCEVAMYYYRGGAVGSAARMVESVQIKVIRFYQTSDKKENNFNMSMALGRLMEAQSLLCGNSESAPSELTAVTALYRHYSAAHPDGAGWSSRHCNTQAKRARVNDAVVRCCRRTRSMELWRRARAVAATALPAADARTAARLHATLTQPHAPAAAQTKIDNRLRFIAGQRQSGDIAENEGKFEFNDSQDEHSTIDKFKTKLPNTPVCMHRSQDFLQHTSCTCYACDTPSCTVLTCQMESHEAALYYRAGLDLIAKNYYEGAIETFHLAEKKLNDINKQCKCRYNNDICDIANVLCMEEFKYVKLEFLIELIYYQLLHNEEEKVNKNIVCIHEMLEDHQFDKYITNEVSNLLVTAAKLKENRYVRTHLQDKSAEIVVQNEVKTPISKGVVKINKEIEDIADEELPKRLKVIKLNLADDDDDGDSSEIESKPTHLQVPKSKLTDIEKMTPKPTRSKLKQEYIAQNTPKIELFTPYKQVTTSSQTFKSVDANSVKKYSRKNDTFKAQFLVPQEESITHHRMRETARKCPKMETPIKPDRGEIKKKLVRATSPGKLENAPQTRSRRRADNK